MCMNNNVINYKKSVMSIIPFTEKNSFFFYLFDFRSDPVSGRKSIK